MRNENENMNMNDEAKLRNPLCIRWDDDGHRRLTDAAWRRRLSASELVRRMVSEGLDRLEAEVVAEEGK